MRARVMGRIAVGALLGCALVVPTGAGAEQGVTPGHMVDVSNYPKGGPPDISEVTFPMTLQQSTGQRGYYYSQEFFHDSGNINYTGIKPQGRNPDGTFATSLAFSTFAEGASTQDPNCKPGADGGPGVTCNAPATIVANRTYDFRANRIAADTRSQTWDGTAVDTATGQAVHLGRWTVPASLGKMRPSSVAFLEHYASVPSCEQVPPTSAFLGTPRFNGKPLPLTNGENHSKQQKCPGKGGSALENGGLRIFN